MTYAESKKFEKTARNALQKELNTTLEKGEIDINGRAKNFDFVNVKERIVGDAKYIKRTKSGYFPSAKISNLNEYAFLMQKVQQFKKRKWRKIFVLGQDSVLAKYYISKYDPWLDDIEIYFCKRNGELKKLR